MLNKYKQLAVKNRKYFFERYLKITLFSLMKKNVEKKKKNGFYKKLRVRYVWIHSGKRMSEKKITHLDLNRNLGQYSFTRKLYAKPDKFFRFKY